MFEITPKAVPTTCATRLGWPKFARLNRLNASIRSCRRAVPPSRTFLITDRSSVGESWSESSFRPRFPKWNAPPAETGIANTEFGPQGAVARLGSQTELSNHCEGSADDSWIADQVRPQCVGRARERGVVRDDVDGISGLA